MALKSSELNQIQKMDSTTKNLGNDIYHNAFLQYETDCNNTNKIIAIERLT